MSVERGSMDASISTLDARLGDLLRSYPERNRTLHEMLGEVMLPELRRQIPVERGVHTYRTPGTVRTWQYKQVGSRGGYVALRPYRSRQSGATGAVFTAGRARDNITIYVNSGHRIRRPRGGDPKYRPRIRVPYVDGIEFYSAAEEQVVPLCLPIVKDFAQALADELGAPL